MTSTQHPTLEEVLSAFAVEDSSNTNALLQYLKDYPEYAEDLIDLSREIHKAVLDDDAELSTDDRARIEAAWQRYVKGTHKTIVDPLAALSVSDIREIATILGVKRQVLAAFREHRVFIDSVPKRFLSRLAAAAKTNLDDLRNALAVALPLRQARSYKADSRPEDQGAVKFERLLVDAGYSDKERAVLMSEDE